MSDYSIDRKLIAKDPLEWAERFAKWMSHDFMLAAGSGVRAGEVQFYAGKYVDILECAYRMELACELAKAHHFKDSKELDEFIHSLQIPYVYKYSDLMKLKTDVKLVKHDYANMCASYNSTYRGYGAKTIPTAEAEIDAVMLHEAEKRGPDVLNYVLEEMPELARMSSSSNELIQNMRKALEEYDAFVAGEITLDEISDLFYSHKNLVKLLKEACKEKLYVIALGEFGKGKDARSVLDSNKRKILDDQVKSVANKINAKAKKVSGYSVTGMSDEDFEKKMRNAASML